MDHTRRLGCELTADIEPETGVRAPRSKFYRDRYVLRRQALFPNKARHSTHALRGFTERSCRLRLLHTDYDTRL